MPGNRGVAYMGPGKVEITDLNYPEFMLKTGQESTLPTLVAKSHTGRF
jgi:hypothetical protein